MPGPSIRFSEPIPGRLLLLRLESSPATYVVCTYQFVWNETPSVDSCVADREHFWTSLSSTLRGIPWRAQLLIMGDMNTPCSTDPPFIGPGITPLRGEPRQRDAPRFQQLLSQFGLAVLNTWGRQKHSHTYQFESGTSIHRTQIDFIITRAKDADPLASSARTLPAPFVPHKGMRHFPLITSLPPPSSPHRCSPSHAPPTAQEVNHSLQTDCQVAAKFQSQVAHLLPPASKDIPVPVLNP